MGKNNSFEDEEKKLVVVHVYTSMHAYINTHVLNLDAVQYKVAVAISLGKVLYKMGR